MAAVAGAVVAAEMGGLTDRLYRIPYALGGLRLIVILFCAGLAALFLFARDEEARGLSKWLVIVFTLAMAAAQTAMLAAGVRNPSELFQE